MKKNRPVFFQLAGLAVMVLMSPGLVLSHCDAMDGPVVKAAMKALEAGDVRLALVWVPKKDEAAVKKLFQKTVAVRAASPEARELADTYFFETVVRLHRAGEGAPYTGLKPAGQKLGPAIAAADAAVESGMSDALSKLVTDAYQKKLAELFKKVTTRKKYKPADVEGGRRFVEAYVEFIHYAEGLYLAATAEVKGHFPEH